MPIARLGETLVFFAHIPKTGGTSIDAYLRARGRVAMHHNSKDGWLPCSPQHMHAALTSALVPKGFCDHSFAVLRDPVDRLKSEYRHRAMRAEGVGKTIAPFDEWAPRVLRLARSRPYLFDNHLRPQIEFTRPGMRLFRFEEGLNPVFDWIDGIIGDTTPAPREWKRNLSHVDVEMSAETEGFIRRRYKADYALLEKLAAKSAK